MSEARASYLCYWTMCIVAALAACGDGNQVTFTVQVESISDQAGVELLVCDRWVEMARLDNSYVSSEQVSCEGVVIVRVRLADGNVLACEPPIYVVHRDRNVIFAVEVVEHGCVLELVQLGDRMRP